MKICVAGTWHQASIVSACLADMGYEVVGVGERQEEIALLNAAKPLVWEPKLEAIMRRNLRAGRLRYTTDYPAALSNADFAYISIDTPVDECDGSDLGGIFSAARSIAQSLSGDLVLCITAQVPVGTCDQIAAIVAALNSMGRCEVAYVPEFLRLGTAVDNFRHPDRIVIGAKSTEVAKRIAQLYQPLECPIVLTDTRSAEMAKHAANAFLATSISFVNEVANLCEVTGADALEVAKILRLDRRIGKHAFLSPGLGFAGGTLGRELRAMQALGASNMVPTPLTDAVWRVNSERAALPAGRLVSLLGALDGKHICILGLTYKAGTSTLRRAISLTIVKDLVRQGARVNVFDPLANLAEVSELPPMRVFTNPIEAASECAAVVLVTEWAGIRSLDFARLRAGMHGDVFFDTRNLLDPEVVSRAGFRYFGIGR